MKVLLLTPPTDLQGKICPEFSSENGPVSGLGKDHGLVSGLWPPLELLSIGSAIEAEGHSVSFLEGYHNSPSEIISWIEENEPDLLISGNSPLWNELKDFFNGLKERFPDLFLILEGREILSPKNYLEDCNSLDMVVYGEGEETIQEVVLRLEEGQSLKGVKGSCIRYKGEIIKNAPREPLNWTSFQLPTGV